MIFQPALQGVVMSQWMKLPEQPPGVQMSRWAIQHASLTRFMVVLILAAGASRSEYGQKEDPISPSV